MTAMPLATIEKAPATYLLHCNNSGDYMLEGVEPKAENDRHSTEWRVVASAWAIALLLVMLFAGMQALACPRAGEPRSSKLAGAVIPRHDPASAGVGIPCATPLEECGKSATALVPEVPYPYPVW